MQANPVVPKNYSSHQQGPLLEEPLQTRMGRQGWSINIMHASKEGRLAYSAAPRGIHTPDSQGTYFPSTQTIQMLKKDDTWQDTWIPQLIAAQSEVWNQPKNALWKQLHSTEQIQKMACNVWHILSPTGATHPLSMVITPDKRTGKQQACSKKDQIGTGLPSRGRQTLYSSQHTPLLTQPNLTSLANAAKPKHLTLSLMEHSNDQWHAIHSWPHSWHRSPSHSP